MADRDDDTYENYYATQTPGTDGQGSYFGDEPQKIVSDQFCAITLSRRPELWQSFPAEKQTELERSSEPIAIENKLESLSSKLVDSMKDTQGGPLLDTPSLEWRRLRFRLGDIYWKVGTRFMISDRSKSTSITFPLS
jgi:hypothetical protein